MIKRGDIYYADLSPVIGSEQGGIRPVLVIQNDVGNKYTHIELDTTTGLPKDSVVLTEQLRTLDKQRLKDKIGALNPDAMRKVNNALMISLGFFN